MHVCRKGRTCPLTDLASTLATVSRGHKKALLRIILLFMVGLLAFCLLIDGAEEGGSVKVVVSDNRVATCYEEQTGGFAGPMLVRSQVLVAPDGEHRAYTESLAAGGVKLPSDTGGWLSPECANITWLFVANSPGDKFRQVLTIIPEEQTLGNAIWLVDWSPNSRYLLFKSFAFQWGSDAAGSAPVLYDAQSGTSSDPECAYEAFKKWAGRSCFATIEPLGFSSEDKAVLNVGPSYPVAPEAGEETKPEPDSCVKRPGLWLYEPDTGKLTKLPAGYKVKHFGKFESSRPQERPSVLRSPHR
jgi:hypothetical protein